MVEIECSQYGLCQDACEQTAIDEEFKVVDIHYIAVENVPRHVSLILSCLIG